MKYISEVLSTPVAYDCDVVVCGGGTTGFVAALAAARSGAKTILVERWGFIGGTLINGAGPIHSFFNVYKAWPNAKEIQCIRGIPSEIVDRMVEEGHSYGHLEQDKGGSYDSRITLIDWERFKDTAFKMLEEAGVTTLLHTMTVGVTKDGDNVTGVIIEGKGGREVIKAKAVIDCTGDADICNYAGCGIIDQTYDPGTKIGYPFGMANVDMERYVAYCKEKGIIYQIIEGDKGSDKDHIIRVGVHLAELPEFKEFMDKNQMWGPLGFSYHENNYTYINGCNLKGKNPCSTVELSECEMILRRQAMEWADMMIKYLPGFEKAYVNWTPSSVGIRGTRIVDCEYDLCQDEIVNCARFDDEVMVYGFHDKAPEYLIKDAGYYGIPYRAFIPKKVDGILVAGRSITTEWLAHMSTRNTGSCMAQGQAVGTAAAMAAKQGVTVRNVDIKELQAELKRQGVFLGEE